MPSSVNGTVCDAQQYQQSLSSLTSLDPSITCLTHGQSIGLALTAEASFISLISVVMIFILIVVCLTPVHVASRFNPAQRNIVRHKNASPMHDWKLLRVPPDIYMLSLFIFDVIHAIGGILNIRWAGRGIITTGPYCSAQGIIKQIGQLGTALVTLVCTFTCCISTFSDLKTHRLTRYLLPTPS